MTSRVTPGTAVRLVTMWSRSTSVSASILWVTCECEQRQADARVEGARRHPVDSPAAGQQPAVGTAPEPHVVTLRGVAVDFLLVGEVLLSFEEEQRAHGSVVVAPAPDGRGDDPPRRRDGHRVGLRPSRGRHGLLDLLLRAEERQIHGVAEESVARPRATDEVVRNVDRREDAVQPREHEVGEQHPEGDRPEQRPTSRPERLGEAEVREPDRRKTREDEEEPVDRDPHRVAAAAARRLLVHVGPVSPRARSQGCTRRRMPRHPVPGPRWSQAASAGRGPCRSPAPGCPR